MDDLRRRFAALDTVATPDLWDAIEGRSLEFGALAPVTPVALPRRTSRRSRRQSTVVLLVAAAAVIALIAGIITVGSGPTRRPAVVQPEPSPSLAIVPTATPSSTVIPSPSSSPLPVGLVAYTVSEPIKDCHRPLQRLCTVDRIWVVNADGTDAHRLPQESVRGIVGWTSDGSQLMYSDNGNLAMTDPSGSTTVIVPNRPWCPPGQKQMDCEITLVESGTASSPVLVPDRTLCPAKVRDDNCGADIEGGVAVSPDGSRIGYVVSEGRELDQTTIVIYDLSSGRVTRLQSTRTQGSFQCRTTSSQGVNGRPTWSPDGTKLAFERQVIGPLRNGGCQATVFVVDADGGNLVQLVPERMVALSPSWSPDGTRVAFHTATPKKGYGQDETAATADIYTVRPDGHDLRRLTDDGTSTFARWTINGRIVYRHLRSLADETAETWIMDADGANKHRIADDDISVLSELGCTICTYTPDGQATQAYWQPQT